MLPYNTTKSKPRSGGKSASNTPARFVTLNKNLINQNVLAYFAEVHGVTRREFMVLFELIALAKAKGKKTLRFETRNELLKFLGLGIGGWQHNLVQGTLDFWQGAGFTVERYYNGKDRARRTVRVDKILTWETKPDGEIVIKFDEGDFWKSFVLNPGFQQHDLVQLRKLRTTTALLLYIKLDAFGWSLDVPAKALSATLGLKWRGTAHLVKLVNKALGQIEAVTGRELSSEAKGKQIAVWNRAKLIKNTRRLRKSDSKSAQRLRKLNNRKDRHHEQA